MELGGGSTATPAHTPLRPARGREWAVFSPASRTWFAAGPPTPPCPWCCSSNDLLETDQGAGRQRLDGARTATERVGDFRLRQAGVIAEHDHGPLAERQRRDGVGQVIDGQLGRGR